MRCVGGWAGAYAVGVVTLLYCDALIAVFMVFIRVPFLHRAGTGSELGVQLLVLGMFVDSACARLHPSLRTEATIPI